MQFLQKVKLIQGGMGVYVSTGGWRCVAMEQPASLRHRSGTALDIVYVRLLQLGDPVGTSGAPWQPSMRSSV